MSKNNWPAPSAEAMNRFYGNPRGSRGPNPQWEAENIVNLVPPHQLYYPATNAKGQITNKRGVKLTRLRVHKKVKASLTRILQRIGDECTPEEIKKYELDICGGVYVYRAMRGGQSLSVHSWGAAIDLSHIINAWKKKWTGAKGGMMPEKVIKIFEDEGWTFGGVWRTADAMHFEATNRGQKRTTEPDAVYGIMAQPAIDEDLPEPVDDGPAMDMPVVGDEPPARQAPNTTVQAVIKTRVQHNDKATVERVQNLLKERGYAFVGKTDGIIGENTSAAIFAFRKKVGLEPFDAVIDDDLLSALNTGPDKDVAPERAQATVEQAAANSEPVAAVVTTTNQVKKENAAVSFWGWLLGLPAVFGGFIVKVLENLNVSKEHIDSLKAVFGSVDPAYYVMAVGGVAIYLAVRGIRAARAADRTQQVTADAYRTGEVN